MLLVVVFVVIFYLYFEVLNGVGNGLAVVLVLMVEGVVLLMNIEVVLL